MEGYYRISDMRVVTIRIRQDYSKVGFELVQILNKEACSDNTFYLDTDPVSAQN